MSVGVGYVVTVHLLPQNATLSELLYVTAYYAAPHKQTIMQSADDAKRMVEPALTGSKIVVWAPERWSGDIINWLAPCKVETWALPPSITTEYFLAIRDNVYHKPAP